MQKASMERYILQYLESNPAATEEEFLAMFREIKKKAMISGIPAYVPLGIVDKKEIVTEYEENRRKMERVQHQDESTEMFE
ncbi:hypothetical protein HCB27_16690 [Listeria booriae]|uniref:Uncharacterized protein n=1 Tax=Listeria booriae TaxID=1552123 RepID=A0A7X1DA20_9LIST|nr:hypothetical protein [Listeria booriae]MBC1914189.1 hypothetical protein [Listeria booriae]MBC2178205.1 hypothetical protein [Listeria booriae]MBC2178268.1 hypothetical protein [Listeria booriae]